jgi:hypothetical protein
MPPYKPAWACERKPLDIGLVPHLSFVMAKYLIQADDVMRVEKRAVRSLTYSAAATQAPEILYSTLVELSEAGAEIPADFVPIGTVEFCRKRMGQLELVEPPHMTYPTALRAFLGRELTPRRYEDVPQGAFVKPLEAVKLFTGHLKGSPLPEDVAALRSADNVLVWSCSPVEFICEVRYYVLSGQIVGFGRYDDGPDGSPLPDMAVIQAAVSAMNQASPPAGYALDFGVTNAGATLLVEANDGWALGLYRSPDMAAQHYLQLVTARWNEIGRSNS